jgi:hypothetical protein
LFTQIIIWNSKGEEVLCDGTRVNRNDMVLLSTKNNSSAVSSPRRNEKVKRARAGVV